MCHVPFFTAFSVRLVMKSSAILFMYPILVGGFFHGQNTNAKFDFLSIVAFALKISQDIHKIFTF